jgi:hypothetical protein
MKLTERTSIIEITARLEERLAARLVEEIRRLLARRSTDVQLAVLVTLLSEAVDRIPPAEGVP